MPKKVLVIEVVEDEFAMTNALVEKLKHHGFETTSARNGEVGLTMALSEKPDLILLDIVMPVMDGMTMLQKLRASGDWGKKVPVILLTNLTADDQILKGVAKYEPSYYLVKTNWTLEDVVQKIKDCLGA